jgi:hypothetical protein
MEVIIHICMVFGYDMLCDLLEVLNLINIGSAVATCWNLHVVDPIQQTNMRGLGPVAQSLTSWWPSGLERLIYARKVYTSRFDSDGYLFFSIYFLFLCVTFFRRIFQYYPLSSIDFFNFQNRLVECNWYVYEEYIMSCTLVLLVRNSRIVYIPQMIPCRAPRDPCRRQACYIFIVKPCSAILLLVLVW